MTDSAAPPCTEPRHLYESCSRNPLDRCESIENCERLDRTEKSDPAERTEKADRKLPIEQMDRDDPIDPSEHADPIDPIEHADPIDPIEHADPIDPIDRTEPLDPIERNDPSDQSESGIARARRPRAPGKTTWGGVGIRRAGSKARDMTSDARITLGPPRLLPERANRPPSHTTTIRSGRPPDRREVAVRQPVWPLRPMPGGELSWRAGSLAGSGDVKVARAMGRPGRRHGRRLTATTGSVQSPSSNGSQYVSGARPFCARARVSSSATRPALAAR